MQFENPRRTALQYPLVHWTLCRCQQYGAVSMKALARYQVMLLGEQRHIRCQQLAQGYCPNNVAVGVEPATSWSRVQRPTATLPSHLLTIVLTSRLSVWLIPCNLSSNCTGVLCTKTLLKNFSSVWAASWSTLLCQVRTWQSSVVPSQLSNLVLHSSQFPPVAVKSFWLPFERLSFFICLKASSVNKSHDHRQ